jgi:hypothetical protein
LATPQYMLPPEVGRYSGLYSFISPESFGKLGINPDDVPLGTFPAEDHPPFLPNRFGGNAYGLGFYEQSVLADDEARLLDNLDLADPEQVRANYTLVNELFKRLGLLIRFSSKGEPYYLIPRQYVAHYLVEIQAKTEEITSLLGRLLPKRLREDLSVAILAPESELLLPQIKGRMPDIEFSVIDTLEDLVNPPRRYDALLVATDPFEFVGAQMKAAGRQTPSGRRAKDAHGYFVAGLLLDLVDRGGEILFLCESPLEPQREKIPVRFNSDSDYKRFLMFSHVYRTKRHYKSGQGKKLTINLHDFNAFLSGLGVYHEMMERCLGLRSLAEVSPGEIDTLPYQDLPLPRGSAERKMRAWSRWLEPFFEAIRLDTILPEAQRRQWEENYQISGEFPATMMIYHGRGKLPKVNLDSLEGTQEITRLVGCATDLVADYKNSFEYVLKVLDIVNQVRAGDYSMLPGLELSRLRKPFESGRRSGQLMDASNLMDQTGLLARLEERLNPGKLLGPRTPVLSNLGKLSLMGMKKGPLKQLYLIVLGHSTLNRVTFGKLPEESLQPLTDLANYRDLEHAVNIMRLYRLMSVAETAAAARGNLRSEQITELFSLYDDAIRVVTDPGLSWKELLAEQVTQLGGVQAKATRKMLKLFDLFEFLPTWQSLRKAGTCQKEALADYDPWRLSRIQQVIKLERRLASLVGEHYPGGSSARPYFFRMLLSSQLHGTSRLLPRLGTEAGVTLLWICVHVNRWRRINFNSLIDMDEPGQLDDRLDKLRSALLELTPKQLSPQWLIGLRQAIEQRGEAYLYGSGLFLTEDQSSRALVPRFIDPQQRLDLLEFELENTRELSLALAPPDSLRAMDQASNELWRYLGALARDTRLGRAVLAALPGMAERYASLTRRLEEYLLSGLFDLKNFESNLKLLTSHCPRLMGRLLPMAREPRRLKQRCEAARKLCALYTRNLERFQDMVFSHETARAEFGPTAAGIVGVSHLQFGSLTASFSQILEREPRIGVLLMLAVILYQPKVNPAHGQLIASQRLERGFKLSHNLRQRLQFLLDNVDVYWQIISGESAVSALGKVLKLKDPLLVEALFLLAVINTAVRKEGLLSEDLLERFIKLQRLIRDLMQRETSAKKAHRQEIFGHAKRYVAFMEYKDVEPGELPPASLRYLLNNTEIPASERRRFMKKGRLEAGLDRLLKLRGLLHVGALDLQMLRSKTPVAFIYNLKGLRSVGGTHFERDLYEGLRIYRGLSQLEANQQEFLLQSLADPDNPLRLAGYNEASRLLTYNNQIRLLLLALIAARRLEFKPGPPRTVSFWPLANVIERKFELINQAVTDLESGAMLKNPQTVWKLFRDREGLTLRFKPQTRSLSIAIGEPVHFDRKLESIRQAGGAEQLKRIYHRELKKFKLTSYSTLDYQQRLDEAFEDRLDELGQEMLERVRGEMTRAGSITKLLELFEDAWEEGLGLPLSQDRQGSLRDLLEMNLERLRGSFLKEVRLRLKEVESLPHLDRYWNEVKQVLQKNRTYFGKDFDLIVAERFDQKAWELSAI